MNAAHPELAWEFLEFMNSEEMARLKANSEITLVSRPSSYNDQINGIPLNLSAFYTKKPFPMKLLNEQDRKLRNLEMYIKDVGRKEFREVLLGNKSGEAALQEFRTKVKENLDNWKRELGIE